MNNPGFLEYRFYPWQQPGQNIEVLDPFSEEIFEMQVEMHGVRSPALGGGVIYQAISCHDLIGPSRLKQPPAQRSVVLRISRPQTTTGNHLQAANPSSGFAMGPNKEAEGSEPAPITPGGTYSIQVRRVSRRPSLVLPTRR